MIVPGVEYVPGRNDYSDRDGHKYGIAIHNTSNDAPASGEASFATRRTDGVSAHFYVDDRVVIQSIDTKYRTGHAGSTTGNENAVSVEITGTNGKSREWWIANVAWGDLGRVLAAVCRAYDIEPRRASVSEMRANPKVRAFYSHDDMRRAWGGTTHTDPGPNFPWDHLFAKVKQAMNGEDDDMSERAEEQIAEIHELLTRWRSGMPTMADGKRTIEPVGWRIRDEQWQPKVVGLLAALSGQIGGLDTEAVLARIEALAELERQRDAELVELVQRAASGELSAQQVVDELARRLAAGPTSTAP